MALSALYHFFGVLAALLAAASLACSFWTFRRLQAILKGHRQAVGSHLARLASREDIEIFERRNAALTQALGEMRLRISTLTQRLEALRPAQPRRSFDDLFIDATAPVDFQDTQIMPGEDSDRQL